MPIVSIFIISAFLLVIGLNALIIRNTIHRALRKTIIPDLQEKGFEYLNYKWCGIFGTGDFNENIRIGPFSSAGSASQSIYINIFFNADKQPRKVTARIDTLFLFIRRVVYSDNP